MADLRTCYLGFELPHPLVPGACPVTDDLNVVRRLQDLGAPILTVRSLIAAPVNLAAEINLLDRLGPASPPRSLFAGLHETPDFVTQPERYAEHLAAVRDAVGAELPVVGSLYARRMEDWLANAMLIEQSGADALELNVYGLSLAAEYTGQSPAERIADVAKAVRRQVRIPIAVKLLPLYDRFEHFVRQLPEAGADALVLFNGFYRSDLGVEALQDPLLQSISSPVDPSYRLRWLSRIAGGVGVDLAFSGGARRVEHVVQALLCGANAVQLVSLLLKQGIDRLQMLRDELDAWLDQHGYESVQQLQGQITMQRFDSLESFDLAYNRRVLMGPT